MDFAKLLDLLTTRFGLAGVVLFVLVATLFHAPTRAAARTALVRVWHSYQRPVAELDLTRRDIKRCVVGILWNFIVRFDACRAYIFEYEDYDDRIKPLPWKHCSCTYEVCNNSRVVNCEQPSLQQLPLDAIPYWRDQLGKEREICLHDVDSIKDSDMESWKILSRQQIKSVYCIGLSDFRGKPFGFVGLDFCYQSRGLSSLQLNMLRNDSIKLSGLLAVLHNGTLLKLAGTL